MFQLQGDHTPQPPQESLCQCTGATSYCEHCHLSIGRAQPFLCLFRGDNTAHAGSAPAAAAEEVSPLSLSVADVTRSFKRMNIRKAVGPDGIPGRVLKACAFQLAWVFTDIFNLSLSLSVVPACFKKSTIVPIPKKNKITCLNDWRPVALTPIFSKCFEKLIREYICSVLPASLDPLQFAYRSNRSTDDAIAFTLHYSGAIESVLTQCISVWYGNSLNQDCKALQRVVRLAEHISGSALPSLQDIYFKRCKSRADKILKDSNHPGNHLFCILPSGKRFRSMMAKTGRLRRSFFPQAIRLLNTNSVS